MEKITNRHDSEAVVIGKWMATDISIGISGGIYFCVVSPDGEKYYTSCKERQNVEQRLREVIKESETNELFEELEKEAKEEAKDRFMDAVDEFLGEDNYQLRIRSTFDSIRDMVLAKNETYGNSVFEGVYLFGEYVQPKTACVARISDKMKRLQTLGLNDDSEDAISDLIGYLVALKLIIEDENYFESDE